MFGWTIIRKSELGRLKKELAEKDGIIGNLEARAKGPARNGKALPAKKQPQSNARSHKRATTTITASR